MRDLAGRILNGEVFVLRRGLQQVGLFEPLVECTLEAICASAGREVADKVREGGFDRIHEWLSPLDLPGVTDAVYAVLTPRAHSHLQTLVPRVFPGAERFYYEKSPNVRFHIPFDHAARYRREFDKFAEKRGQGKIAAHGPHRDQWVDCPSNAINIWIAVGPVRHGNSLTVFTQDYETRFAFKDGYILNGQRLHKPLSFDLAPGDAVLFLSHHLHGSEVNRTDRTRYVVSYRVTFGKPHYPHGHYHHYLHSGLAGGPLRQLAHIPQNLQAS
ncbi:MAG: phytanoyl-CoA dioxygenase family protein, partial [Acidobacteriota bacterium]